MRTLLFILTKLLIQQAVLCTPDPRKVQVAKILALLTSDQEVLVSNPARGWNSAHDCMALYCTEPFIIILPSSRCDLNNVEKDEGTPNHYQAK